MRSSPTARVPAALVAAAMFASLLPLAPAALAGPLDPPAGPVAPTHKTLTEVEPCTPLSTTTTPGDDTAVFRITQPGSYYLTANLVAPAGKHGIAVRASNVTIDLRGFSLAGGGGSNIDGVTTAGTSGFSNITIKNGEVINWGGCGVSLAASVGTLIEGLVARDNGLDGILVGRACVVRFCTVNDNDQAGVNALDGGVIESCYAFNNVGSGLIFGQGSAVRGCVSRANSGPGFNGGAGVVVIDHCTAFGNNLSGIDCGNNSTIESCVMSGNNGSGVAAASNCVVRNNLCTLNAVGVRLTGSDSRVEGNNALDNVQGVNIDLGGNIILRNTCSGNGTNWIIAAGNALAPIVNASTNPNPVSGNTYAGNLGSTDPNANFSY